MMRVSMTLEGSMANQRYLGKYMEFFDDDIEQPIPTWLALALIFVDYGLSRSEPMAIDIIYKQISGPWSSKPPPAIQCHLQFCLCDGRHKWAPYATINST